jgi:NAD(P)-dependent dehydrogenase (short-subunit alcohol dehydrogenase family)
MDALTGKVAVVTGASKGIGAGIAKALGDAGAAVVVNDVSSRADGERVVAAIAAAAVFLASEHAAWITGESIRVSGELR